MPSELNGAVGGHLHHHLHHHGGIHSSGNGSNDLNGNGTIVAASSGQPLPVVDPQQQQLETRAWTVAQWRMAAIDAVRRAQPRDHVQRLEAVRRTCHASVPDLKRYSQDNIDDDAKVDAAWIYVATADQIQLQWDRAVAAAAVPAAQAVAAAHVAGAAEFPALFGVPIAVKDNIDVAGFPTTAACPGFTFLPQASASVVQHLESAGAIVLGKTNLDQFATGLVGTRSPYGAPRNSLSSQRISGGSSSGSGIVVSRGIVPLALGTDTAGSGRVPAGFGNIVGVKPTRGLLSTCGVVPACRTLDCVSIFALTLADAQCALAVTGKYDAADPYSREADLPPARPRDGGSNPSRLQVAVPNDPIFASSKSTPEGADLYRDSYMTAIAQLPDIWHGAEVHRVDFTPLYALAALLYEGPWVAERWAAVRDYVERSKPADTDPTVLKIVRGAEKFSAADAFTFEYKAAYLRRTIEQAFGRFDVLIVPTTPMPAPKRSDIAADPVAVNSTLGTYTNFVNLADWCALALPGGFCRGRAPAESNDPLAFGLTFLSRGWNDFKLLDLGSKWLAALERGQYLLGATGRQAMWAHHTLPQRPLPDNAIQLAVVGAHLRGMPLHHELERAGAVLVHATHTAEKYKLYALGGTTPRKPGLFRTEFGGRAIEIEVYAMLPSGFGRFVAGVPQPLAIGSVECADGSWVHGFVCEPRAIEANSGSIDVTKFRGWRHYIRSIAVPPLFHTVLVANRGEIAVRCIRTLQQLGIRAISIYAEADRYAQHVLDADEAILLEPDADKLEGSVASGTYLNIPKVIAAAKRSNAQAILPGYGFLSENPMFSDECSKAGIVFVGPTAHQMNVFGQKHTARAQAESVNVPLIPGTGLLPKVEDAVVVAQQLGYPVMVKSTAGGGGIGLQKCANEQELREGWERVLRLGANYFGNDGIFLEKCIQHARHVEIQIIGDGRGNVIALGDRDCSLQRRHQKVIEESPALLIPAATRSRMAECSVNLLKSVNYHGAGTVEYVFDANSGDFYFLEVNARLQVEHPVTEAVLGIDLIEWMVRIASGQDMSPDFEAMKFLTPQGHALEVRVYAEDPNHNFAPCAGTLSTVVLPTGLPGVRVDGWVTAGTTVSAHFDPLLAKIIAHGPTRNDALLYLMRALEKTSIEGISTNLAYLRAIVASEMFAKFNVHTRALDSFAFATPGLEIISPGTSTTVQDYPGRIGYWDVGVPPSGPMDAFAFRLANSLVGNLDGAPALECTLQGPTLKFSGPCVIAVTGAAAPVSLDSKTISMWTPHQVHAGQTLAIGIPRSGCRSYLAVSGGLQVAQAMGSKSTFALAGTGGLCGRVLRSGDLIPFDRSSCNLRPKPLSKPLDQSLIPNYAPDRPGSPKIWHVGAMLGPHAAPDYLTHRGLEQFLETEWQVSHNANRLGIRLVGPPPQWTRNDGGEAGLHPSNVLDCCYAIGSVNLTGDTPTILTVDGPSLGGFVCPVTIVKAEMWKVGQLKPGDLVRFCLLSFDSASALYRAQDHVVTSGRRPAGPLFGEDVFSDNVQTSALLIDRPATDTAPKTEYRAAGDGALLLEYGDDKVDLTLRFRVHALMEAIKTKTPKGLTEMVPGVRSLQVQFDSRVIHQSDLVDALLSLEAGLGDLSRMRAPSRVFHLPLAFQDESSTKAVERYVQTVKAEAPWLPDNVEFLRRINGLASKDDVRETVYKARYLVLGLGDVFYGAPCALPIDPRHRLLSSKYNPARTFTPEGVVGIGGVFMCIYGINSPGGYQLVGRTLPVWDHVRSNARTHSSSQRQGSCPWMLDFFDQVQFYPVSGQEIERLREDYRHGRFQIRIERTHFDLGAYHDMLKRDAGEISQFQSTQDAAYHQEVARWAKEAIVNQSHSSADALAADQSYSTNKKVPEGTPVPAAFASRTWKVLVKPGDKVSAGQALVLVEAMKAELPVAAPRDGVVKAVLCEPGQFLDPTDVVVVLED